MAKIDEKVMSLVEQELEKKPDASVDELYDKAVKVEKSIGSLTKRQFNARYPLQVKRRKGGTSGRKKKSRKRSASRRKKSTTNGAREAVRGVFLRFASDLAAAEARKDVVEVVASVDKYVDEVLKTTGK